MPALSQPLVTAVLESIKTALVKADNSWERIFGSPANLSARFAQKYPVYKGESNIEVDLDFGQIHFPGELAKEWFFSQTLVPADISSRSEVRQPTVDGGFLLIPAIRTPAVQAPVQAGRVVIEERGGLPIADVFIGKGPILSDPVCLRFLAKHLEAVLVNNLLPPRNRLDIEDSLSFPTVVIKTSETHKNEALLGAADLGFVTLEEFPQHSFFSIPQASPSILRVGVANAPRRKLFSHALTAQYAFDQFLKLYQVLEHKFLETHVLRVQNTLSSGQVVVAKALLLTEKSELERLSAVVKDIFSAGGISVSKMKLPYPPAGHAIYTDSGMDSGFEISVKNAERDIARFIYKIRCAIVHAKSDQSYLQPTPDVNLALRQNVMPDLFLMARYLVEN